MLNKIRIWSCRGTDRKRPPVFESSFLGQACSCSDRYVSHWCSEVNLSRQVLRFLFPQCLILACFCCSGSCSHNLAPAYLAMVSGVGAGNSSGVNLVALAM